MKLMLIHSSKSPWFPCGLDGRRNRVMIFPNDQFIIVYTCKLHINHEYSLVIYCSSKMLYFG
jgi:hypothetical protein